jgi:hypothetical protein
MGLIALGCRNDQSERRFAVQVAKTIRTAPTQGTDAVVKWLKTHTLVALETLRKRTTIERPSADGFLNFMLMEITAVGTACRQHLGFPVQNEILCMSYSSPIQRLPFWARDQLVSPSLS